MWLLESVHEGETATQRDAIVHRDWIRESQETSQQKYQDRSSMGKLHHKYQRTFCI